MCRDGALNMEEFTAVCKALFRNETGKPYKSVVINKTVHIYITVVFHNIFKNFVNFYNPRTIYAKNCDCHSVVLMKFPFIMKLNRLIV